ncbi:hypothetical protein KDA11_06105, partial [Candidatus Saccharibacteria bacterium]|nr:hypothetical protein [Candidatus Saccharibacteria bacterium]
MKVLTLDDVKTEERIPRIRVPLHENQRYIVHEIAGLDDKQDDKIRKTVTINEPVGSGKTLMVLAVHALNYRKRPYPLIRQHDGFGIIKIYPQTIIESTMVVCDGLVFDHWINEINTKTELSVCPVSNVTQLNKFINSGKLWDIVLVKNGTSPKIRDLSYLDIIVKHFGNTHWRRVVFDDITMCAFHTTYGAPFALNYIFTMSNEVDKLDAHCARAPPLMHPVLGNRSLLSCAKVLANSEIVRCSEEILGISFELPLITSNEYILDNGNAVALNLLSSLTELTADDTLKLNNDSIKGIARRLGIIAKSLADLVSRLTERNFDKMQKRAQNITLIKEALADITIHEAINDNQLHKAQNDGQLTKVTYANEDEKNQWKEVLAELENSYDEKLSKL